MPTLSQNTKDSLLKASNKLKTTTSLTQALAVSKEVHAALGKDPLNPLLLAPMKDSVTAMMTKIEAAIQRHQTTTGNCSRYPTDDSAKFTLYDLSRNIKNREYFTNSKGATKSMANIDPVFNLRFRRIWGSFCIIRGIKG